MTSTGTYRRCAILLSMLIWPAWAEERREPAELYPPIEPFERGHLKVGDIHEIFYQVCGNPKGKPIFVLHGGPGFGCYPRLRQYFNPDKFMVVLHDQRGAGRSRPAGELRENTIWHLVEDIERLRQHLKIEGKILVFGGSWGTTVALAYAETHPERVAGMVLRGIWTGTEAEIEHGYGGECVRKFFPEAVSWVETAMPPDSPGFTPETLVKIFSGNDAALQRRVIDAEVRYAVKVGQLHATDQEVAQGFGDIDLLPSAKIDAHYAANHCFLEEGQLLRDAHTLRDIPITMINGRYDMLSPPLAAYRLHKVLPKSRLIIVERAGHSEGEPGITQALLQAVAELE